jgi:EpsI family protein
MRKGVLTSVLLGLLMLVSGGTAKVLVPTHYLADSRPATALEKMIPEDFGGWHMERNGAAAVVNPSVEEALKAIYTQTLSRTYVDASGYRVMLSVAYGANQSDGLQLHYPEICYPAQGFEVTSNRSGILSTARGALTVKRLETNLSGQRYEPVTYWTTVGDVVAIGSLNKKLAEMRYRLRGQIPDGLLFRVSSIDTDAPHSFQVHADFVNQLLPALAAADVPRLTGLPH